MGKVPVVPLVAALALTCLLCLPAIAQTAPAPVAPVAGPQMSAFDIVIVALYVLVLGYLGWMGYCRSRTAEDFLIAGRDTHPIVMALSYGSTFISTAAIVGFSGMAGRVGMSMMWLVFLNIFVGIFIAFVVFGAPTRRMGHCLAAHTFPELLGRRYDSRFIQWFSGAIIFVFMPTYAAATLLGGVTFLGVQFGIPSTIGIFIFAVIVAFYVLFGGLRGVMYTDAFQGGLMFFGMLVLIWYGYAATGGFLNAHGALADLASRVPAPDAAMGVTGYTTMPVLGSPIWWTIISSLTLGVGIGVLAQPQLTVRFMTVKSRKELNRAVGIGGLFILVVTGGAYAVGALTNVYFFNKYGKVAIDYVTPVGAKADAATILPAFIKEAMPGWFPILFFLTLLSAAMSTLSSQFHVMGTSLGRDIYEQGIRRKSAADKWTRLMTQVGIAIGIVITILVALKYADVKGGIIAIATSFFFALCASTLLPSYILGLFWRRMNSTAAVASILTGFFFTAFWLLFI